MFTERVYIHIHVFIQLVSIIRLKLVFLLFQGCLIWKIDMERTSILGTSWWWMEVNLFRTLISQHILEEFYSRCNLWHLCLIWCLGNDILVAWPLSDVFLQVWESLKDLYRLSSAVLYQSMWVNDVHPSCKSIIRGRTMRVVNQP